MSSAPKIKFCGITRLEDAEHAAELEAWAVGMIFWQGSKRRCRLDDAAAICGALRRRTELAGVFVDAHLDELVATADALELTLVQLHGDEGPAYCAEVARRTGAKVIKAARVHDRADVRALHAFAATDFHLLDAHVPGEPGGTGQTFAWELARERPKDRPLILSGGLTAENVAEAIAAVEPFAVDVASGIEASPGIKDHARMTAFAQAVCATAPQTVATPPAAEDAEEARSAGYVRRDVESRHQNAGLEAPRR